VKLIVYQTNIVNSKLSSY